MKKYTLELTEDEMDVFTAIFINGVWRTEEEGTKEERSVIEKVTRLCARYEKNFPVLN